MSALDPFGICDSVVDGRYRVERVVGQGGFGVVYRARHLGFDSPIALKVLKLPEEWSSVRREARLAGFQREGRMLFELSYLHPSIVRAFETGTIRGRDGSLAPYLALEWLEGASLDRELKSRRMLGVPPLSLNETLALLRAPAEGLARAHSKGIAHRDVKPGNLFISTRDGEQSVKILDFGVAKLVNHSLDEPESLSSTTVTAGFTPLYAAPEQWHQALGATGAWTDVHALALVVVELLTGSAPFGGDKTGRVREACLAARRPTPGARGVALSKAVEDVLARALALEPRARFPEAGAFWADLCAAAQWSGREGVSVLELTSRRSADAERSGGPIAAHSLGPAGSTAATAPPTTRNRAQVPRRRFQHAKSGAVVLGLAAAAGFVTHAAATRVPGAVAPARPVSAVARPSPANGATSALASRAEVPAASVPRATSRARDVGGATPQAHPPVARILTSRVPPTADAAPSAPVPALHSASAAPPALPAPPAHPAHSATATFSQTNPPTASFALPEVSVRPAKIPVNIDDPGLKRRK